MPALARDKCVAELLPDSLETVPEKWHEEFLLLVETGEASEEFLEFLDSDEGCQEAFDRAFLQKVKQIEGFRDSLRSAMAEEEEERPHLALKRGRSVAAVSRAARDSVGLGRLFKMFLGR